MINKQVVLEATGGRGSGRTRMLLLCKRTLLQNGYDVEDYSATSHKLVAKWKMSEPTDTNGFRGLRRKCMNCGTEVVVLLPEGTSTSRLSNICPACGCATLAR